MIFDDIVNFDSSYADDLLRIDQIHIKIFSKVNIVMTLRQCSSVLTSHQMVSCFRINLIVFENI